MTADDPIRYILDWFFSYSFWTFKTSSFFSTSLRLYCAVQLLNITTTRSFWVEENRRKILQFKTKRSKNQIISKNNQFHFCIILSTLFYFFNANFFFHFFWFSLMIIALSILYSTFNLTKKNGNFKINSRTHFWSEEATQLGQSCWQQSTHKKIRRGEKNTSESHNVSKRIKLTAATVRTRNSHQRFLLCGESWLDSLLLHSHHCGAAWLCVCWALFGSLSRCSKLDDASIFAQDVNNNFACTGSFLRWYCWVFVSTLSLNLFSDSCERFVIVLYVIRSL